MSKVKQLLTERLHQFDRPVIVPNGMAGQLVGQGFAKHIAPVGSTDSHIQLTEKGLNWFKKNRFPVQQRCTCGVTVKH